MDETEWFESVQAQEQDRWQKLGQVLRSMQEFFFNAQESLTGSEVVCEVCCQTFRRDGNGEEKQMHQ